MPTPEQVKLTRLAAADYATFHEWGADRSAGFQAYCANYVQTYGLEYVGLMAQTF